MKIGNQLKTLLTATLVAILLSGCRTSPGIGYEAPETYSFTNLNYSGQTSRLDMLEEMMAYMKTANVSGTVLDEQLMLDMFENVNDPFSFQSEKQLKNKCFLADVPYIENHMGNLATASLSTVSGSNGVAGLVLSGDGSKQYLFDEKGWEYAQLIEKGLMGAICYFQATAVYLSADRIGPNVDNTTVTEGEGTPMEHHWDEAFGYLGVAPDFPISAENARFYGKYCNGRNDILESNSVLMNAFLLGRTAIGKDDMTTKDNQVIVIRDTWERVIAGTAIHYLNGAKRDLADDALRNHQLSEAYAFIFALKYNPTKKITDNQLVQVIDHIGQNLYEISISQIDSARDLLSSIYNLDTVKDQL